MGSKERIELAKERLVRLGFELTKHDSGETAHEVWRYTRRIIDFELMNDRGFWPWIGAGRRGGTAFAARVWARVLGEPFDGESSLERSLDFLIANVDRIEHRIQDDRTIEETLETTNSAVVHEQLGLDP